MQTLTTYKHDTEDVIGHGTAVASLIHDVAPKAEIVMVKALDRRGRGDLAHFLDALLMVRDLQPDIVNLSLSLERGQPRPLELIIDDMVAEGVWVVAAAGNYGRGVVRFPAAHKRVIAVGALDWELNPWPLTSVTDDKPEVWSVGVDVLAALPGSRFAKITGTSAAAPIVAGLLALVREQVGSVKVEELVKGLKATGRHIYRNGLDITIPQIRGLVEWLSR